MRKLTNFFKTLLSISTFLLISNITFAQQDSLVKRSYADSIHTATTVVVKNKAASDFDILNNQFNNASFNDVIFIKTEDLPSSKPKSERTSFEDVMKETSKPTSEITPSPAPKKTITKPKSKPVQRIQKPKPVAKKTVKKKPNSEIKRPQKYHGVGGTRKLKMKKKRLKKRKRVKRKKRNNCYQF